MTPDVAVGSWIETDVPPRLDALGWSRWHQRVVFALGITWVLDGFEASLIANLAPTLQDPRTLGLTAAQLGLTNTAYLVGEVLGALDFGYLTDRFGRRRLFLVTLGVYLIATAASGLARDLPMFLALRLVAGSGIGRRVRGDQLRDRRARAGARARTRRPRDQRQLLDRHRGRRRPDADRARPGGAADHRGLAALVRRRRAARARRGLRAPSSAGESALAAAPRLYAAGTRHRRRDRGRGRARSEGAAVRARPRQRLRRVARLDPHDRHALPAPRDPRRRIDVRAGVPLQHDLLQLRARPARVPSRGTGACRALRRAGRDRQLPRSAAARPAVRSPRQAGDDLRDLRGHRRPARGHERAVRRGRARRAHADARVVDRVLRRVGGGELGVPDGERAVSRRATRARDRGVLRVRHARRRRSTDPVRGDHRRARAGATRRRLRPR